MLVSVTLDLDPVDRERSTIGGLGQEGPTSWGSTGQLGRYARAHYLFIYILSKVENSKVRTLCFGVQADIDYEMPEFVPMTPFKVPNSVRGAYHGACMVLKVWVSRQRRCVLIRSDFPVASRPFK
ncbi:hypothetical protein M9H77_28577 [Catharanthus roseus]|uniref:Uncharacterized protein n=1 Tax=Catharanthus roseus TaxID=4058 RepID=A0ACC0AG38_CATRO|nr:hypothetical protein M9H77_28577 [Catharanthus roseus]